MVPRVSPEQRLHCSGLPYLQCVVRVTVFNSEKTGKAGFAKLSLCIREETSRGVGGGKDLKEVWLRLCC